MAVRKIEIQEHEAEIEAMNSCDLIKNSHFGQIIYWSRENEQADGTIRGLDMKPGVVMHLTKEIAMN
ncbi:10048_t:CDS:2 [Cetraspora pellucida]|uniref:10048_t:CDS:1 n=1 Tax=Cetraspora pellucida TaxID=1433469 RepID=A0A9N9ENN6_9GLOM|nr:10048_t:CDS:2 [Cetraspora pellucida]